MLFCTSQQIIGGNFHQENNFMSDFMFSQGAKWNNRRTEQTLVKLVDTLHPVSFGVTIIWTTS